MFNHKLGPVCSSTMIDPIVEALEARLMAHQERGEMIEGDVRYGAMMLISPVLLGCHHQFQMYGRHSQPLELTDMIERLAEVFVRAYGTGVTAH
jgi:hypothetical protein